MQSMRRRLPRVAWLSAQAIVACWFLFSPAVDRQFLFYFVLLLTLPAGLLVYLALAPVLVALEEGLRLGLLDPLNALLWAAVVVAGYWQWFIFLPRHVVRERSGHG